MRSVIFYAMVHRPARSRLEGGHSGFLKTATNDSSTLWIARQTISAKQQKSGAFSPLQPIEILEAEIL